MPDSTKTLCPYCGVGCGLDVSPTANQFWKVIGDRVHPSSLGMVCVKGATVAESLEKDRLRYPQFRENLSDPFKQISWEEALTKIVERIQVVTAKQGVDGICMYGSGQLQTEDYYIAQKLLKGCLGTNNFDTNSRLCMSSAVSAYVQNFGSDGPPCCYEDLDLTDCAFLIGTNTAECHPIIFNRLQKHLKRDPKAKLIVVDPRRTKTAEVADLHLAITPGTDIDLLNGLAHLLLRWGKLDQDFIEKHTQNFADYKDVIAYYSPEIVTAKCGISLEDLEAAARYWAESERTLSLWSMGLNQSSEGTAKICSLINLHLMTGQIGKPGMGSFSLTGQPNAMGGREAGGLSNLLPGYRQIVNPNHRAEIEQAWDVPSGRINPLPGRDAWGMITGLEAGEVGLFWIAATNPAVSLPDLERVKKALAKSPFTVYQDAYYPTETSAFAHLLLPAAQWSEKTGTMTNSERRVTLCSQFREPPGEAIADWQIFAEVGRRLGFRDQFPFKNSAEVYQEFVELTHARVCEMTGISHERLLKKGPLQWPCSDNSTDLENHSAKRLYTDLKFPTSDGRAKFVPFHTKGLAEPPDRDYPFVLTTGRLYGHWHTQTRTGRIEKIVKMHPQPFIEIHPKDANFLQIVDGDNLEVRSRRGRASFPVKITTAIKPGTVFVPMHWGSLWADYAEANALTHAIACPISLEPELKACAVQLIPHCFP
ncbi:MAG: nitrate reductase [Snowella sp.]|nr:nitrate reductase [Snowella sp.]